MSNELITMSTQSALDLSKIHNAALLKESQSLDALVSKLRSGALSLMESAEQVRREQAVILDRIQSTKLYEKDGFKSLAEYGETIGLGKSTTYALARVGKVYNNKKAPAQLKAMSPSNLDAISSALKSNAAQVFKDAENGNLDGMTQDGLREYAKTIAPASKAKVVKTYQAFVLANGHYWDETMVTMDDESHPSSDYTEAEWEGYYTSNGASVYNPHIKDKKTLLVIDPNGNYELVELREYKPKSNGPVKKVSDETAIALVTAKLKKDGMDDEQIANVLSLLGVGN